LIAAGAVWVNQTSTRSGTATSAPPRRGRTLPGSRPSSTPPTDHRLGPPRNPSGWRTRREIAAGLPEAGRDDDSDEVTVRTSTQTVATAKRRRLSQARYAEILNGDQAADGILRRKTVKAPTRLLYTRVAEQFLASRQLDQHSPPDVIDFHLDKAIVQLYLAGESQTESNYLYYAVRWYCCRTNQDFRLAFRSRAGHSRSQSQNRRLPETWEALLLQCHALMTQTHGIAALHEAALACTGFLLSFDLYARALDLVVAKRTELRPPQGAAARGAADCWTITIWPSTEEATSKTHKQDHTRVVGATDPLRKWLTALCRPLLAATRGQDMLLKISEATYVKLFKRGRTLARLAPSSLHRLRHGGASVDGLSPTVSDLDLQDRGNWSSPKSVRIYRQPARYLRELEKLSPAQKASALAIVPALQQLLVLHLGRRTDRGRPR